MSLIIVGVGGAEFDGKKARKLFTAIMITHDSLSRNSKRRSAEKVPQSVILSLCVTSFVLCAFPCQTVFCRNLSTLRRSGVAKTISSLVRCIRDLEQGKRHGIMSRLAPSHLPSWQWPHYFIVALDLIVSERNLPWLYNPVREIQFQRLSALTERSQFRRCLWWKGSPVPIFSPSIVHFGV